MDIHVFDNIIDYNFKFYTNKLNISYCYNIYDNKFQKYKSYYYIIDSASNIFEYLIFENIIFIELLIKLNKYYPNIKILTKNNKNNIQKILNFLNINNDIIDTVDNYNNFTFSPKIYSIYYIHLIKFDTYYNFHLNNFIQLFINNINKNINKNIDYNKPLFIINDNITFNINIIDKNKYNIINYNDDIYYNLNLIYNSKIIFIFYSYKYYFYSFFLKNKQIILIDDDFFKINGIYTHLLGNDILKHIHNSFISKFNKQIITHTNILNDYLNKN